MIIYLWPGHCFPATVVVAEHDAGWRLAGSHCSLALVALCAGVALHAGLHTCACDCMHGSLGDGVGGGVGDGAGASVGDDVGDCASGRARDHLRDCAGAAQT